MSGIAPTTDVNLLEILVRAVPEDLVVCLALIGRVSVESHGPKNNFGRYASVSGDHSSVVTPGSIAMVSNLNYLASEFGSVDIIAYLHCRTGNVAHYHYAGGVT